MRKLLICLAVLLLTISCFAQAKPGDKPSVDVLKAYCDAWSTGGPDKAAAFYDKSADDVFYDIAPLKYKGWSEYDAACARCCRALIPQSWCRETILRCTRRETGLGQLRHLGFRASRKTETPSTSRAAGRPSGKRKLVSG